MTLRRTLEALFPLVLAVSVMGCSSASPPPADGGSASSGSWAEEMAQEYERSTSPPVKAVLEDGVISDREYAEMKQRYASCLAAAGITLTRYDFSGASYNPAPSMSNDQAHDVETKCSGESGEYPIAYFYVQMRANPSHKDLAPAIVDCYKRHGLVGDSYGLKDYRAGDVPTGSDHVTASACSTDPDGLLGG